ALRGSAAVTSATLVVLAALALVLAAATSARERGETLARLRTLGLDGRSAWMVTAGELLPPALVAALGGVAVGVGLARGTLGPLGLRLVTGQAADPVLVIPWWAAGPVLLAVGALAVVVAVESSRRRRERLGLVLRAGS